jgi:hypothetical protein
MSTPRRPHSEAWPFARAERLARALRRRAVMATPNDAKARAAASYNAAADRYDDPANLFWERFDRATVERLRVRCDTGALARDSPWR